jgi:hypothetical protein
MKNIETTVQKNAALFANTDLRALVKSVFKTVDGKKLLDILLKSLETPIYPVTPQITDQYGGANNWAAFRTGQNSLIYLFKLYSEVDNDRSSKRRSPSRKKS